MKLNIINCCLLILMLPYFTISPIKLTVALSSASMASAVEVLLISVPKFRISEKMSCDELYSLWGISANVNNTLDSSQLILSQTLPELLLFKPLTTSLQPILIDMERPLWNLEWWPWRGGNKWLPVNYKKSNLKTLGIFTLSPVTSGSSTYKSDFSC